MCVCVVSAVSAATSNERDHALARVLKYLLISVRRHVNAVYVHAWHTFPNGLNPLERFCDKIDDRSISKVSILLSGVSSLQRS